MKKNELKSLVDKMYDTLLEQISMQENATKEQLINYLKEAIDVLSEIDDKNIDSIEHAKLMFTNTYKEIAKKGLESYQNTNTKFKELSQKHEQTISECFDPQIDINELTEKFNEIQTHMVAEVKKANSVITSLSKQVKTLEDTSNLDSLTQVFNRRALTTYLNNICSKKELPYDLHLLILDLDDFKKINDKFGHVAGDKILIFIANLLKKTLRDGDKVFRYGGEEFIIILNRLNNPKCKDITSRLLKLVSDNKLIYKGENIKVTMSIGTTTLQPHDTPDSLINRADKALYVAKSNGKNQMHSDVKNGN
jgi:diguanylate cyclase (GGDEF)-like protein